MKPLDLVLPRLKGLIQEPDNKGWRASCPAHEDDNSSLSVTVAEDGTVNLCCQAGCQVERVVEALGIQMSDLSPNKAGKSEAAEKPTDVVALPAPKQKQSGKKGKKGKDSEDEKSDLDILMELVTKGADLFHTSDGEEYAAVIVDKHRENWAVFSKGFELWLRRAFYGETGKAFNQETLHAALNQIAAQARFDGPEHEVCVRVGGVDDVIYIDLCDSKWRVVEVTANGWHVVDSPKVRFRRNKGMLSLPEPVLGGSIDELLEFINVHGKHQWHLIFGWLVQALRDKGPYPILIFQGEQGTAKSSNARIIRSLIDPSRAPSRTPPDSERDLVIAADNAWVISIGNLSGLSNWLSDALCRLSTDGGFGTRELYRNREEVIFESKRPIILNGIDDIAERQDLNDRALVIRLLPIPPSKRKTEDRLMTEFEAKRPRIFGALLTALSAALRNRSNVNLPEKPRMADFLEFATAAETGLDLQEGTMVASYKAYRSEAVLDSIEGDDLAAALCRFMEPVNSWEGTATELLNALGDIVTSEVRRSKRWPKASNSLSRRLNRLATFLREAGIDIVHTLGRERRLTIQKKTGNLSSASSGSTLQTLPEAVRSRDSVVDGKRDGIDADRDSTVSDEEAA